MTLYKWSQTAASDATADSTINWAEGQPPSSVNDSARSMMAATAKYRDDIAGAIVTGGTSTAYTVSSYQVFDTLAHLNGQMIAFTPHVTNGAGPVQLNVDSLGQKPIRSAPNADLLAGVLIQGTPYVATYNNTDGAWYLKNFFGNPYNVPLGAGMDFWGSTAPNAAFAFPAGQAISRITYAGLFALVGTTYGTGDGTTTFNLPDKRGRGSAGKDDMGGTAANRLTNGGSGVVGTTLGASGGAETETLTLAQLPTGITVSGVNSITVNSTIGDVMRLANSSAIVTTASPGSGAYAFNGNAQPTPGPVTSTGNNTISATSNNTSGTAHPIVQPTIVCNYIIRVL